MGRTFGKGFNFGFQPLILCSMLPELQCLTQAALNLGYAYRTHDRNGNLLTVEIGERKYLFERNYTPFNTETEARICLDKEHCYQLLQGVVPMPKTLGFFDPKQAAQYNAYKHQASLDQVLDTLDREFRYPLIIKRNRGALASQVHWVQDAPEAGEALRQIFNQQSKEYDYVALAQEFIPTSREFRVVCFRGQLLLAYERFAGQRYFKAAY
ncbi:MAG TPA: hypothetical protein DCR93_23145 [Cytophagales bacterium]|nr:hypothetical protein [Cytophagales bacterium]